ncbi:MAG: GGDEF domain-containing protein, partial [Gammaproteobacteria bacterium]
MNPLNGSGPGLQNDLYNDVFRWICISAILCITPFAIHSLLVGDLILGTAGFMVSGLFLIDFLSVQRLHRPLINRTLALTLMAGASALSIGYLGEAGMYWAFPLVVTLHFILDRRAALIINSVFLIAVTLLAANMLEPPVLLRFTTALLMTSVFACIFAMMVNRQQQAQEKQLITDPLTGAYNRRHLGVRTGAYVQRNRRYGHPASLILFDIDHFKSINDSFGHNIGDRVLRILVDTVKARIRAMDEIFRYGGEEFVILLPDTTLEQGTKLAQDITDMIAQVRMIEGGPVTISCGVGELLKDEDAGSWLSRCDDALYRAKDAGRGRVCPAAESLY